MAEIKVVAEYFVKPKHEVEAAKHPYYLSPVEIAMLSIHPIQKGLLFTLNNTPSSDSNHTQTVSNLMDNLKHSLSIALLHFYPLAGRLATKKYADESASSIYIDCAKGPGARLIHASALDAAVSHIIDDKDVPTKLVHSLFELGARWVNYDGHTRALVSIQVTQLQDGLFIGFTMNHSVVDGTSFIHFVSMLSEIFRSQENIKTHTPHESISRVPVFNCKPWVDTNEGITEVLKLPHLEPEQLIERGLDPGPLRERIFHFSQEAMARLKARANQECATNNVISSFQALCALVWRSLTRARNLSSDQQTSCSVLINARSRLDPPLSDDYFGNLIFGAKGDSNVGELLSRDLGWAAMILHKAIMAQDGNAILRSYKSLAKSPVVIRPGVGPDIHGPNKVIMGGSPRFDMYRPEFGLGRAVAARMGFGNKEDGKVTANPGCEGSGSVDLEICLRPPCMEALENNSEFMSLVSLR